ncbi:hypothetical protein EMIHUDRAFT_260263 [Emiliania huxleyi CCMP1516]|uniref:Uncharacterized protein n=2 Tax=Emiliania huxleyi TaxID=2903 RepID=A0A0D3KWF1_EMIH1|nr:hypothetical protein EMIHUDRAFT_260263 [Emiliania huxleyi CCMP1516]EOD40086.1 hypothetical protein EMIHUDRAFT_260263 [Emiliania huxleyi CCMP1516]|eukprot:XP_005792515.1 hypothetical protein EMIHUDRAFT_260263 [Emiliania huxleyi CCMP1516]
MDPDEASRHMKRCVDSGLWNPTGGEGSPDDDEAEAEGRAKPSEDEYACTRGDSMT